MLKECVGRYVNPVLLLPNATHVAVEPTMGFTAPRGVQKRN